MSDIKTIQKTYENMFDEELIKFAETSLNKISKEAYEALYNEIKKRKLSTVSFSDYENKLIEDEKNYFFPNWNTALQMRKKGKTDEEISHTLINKGISEDKIILTLKRLPSFLKLDDNFEALINKKSDNSSYNHYYKSLILIFIPAFILYKGIETGYFLFIILGIASSIWVFSKISKIAGEFKGGEYWTKKLSNHPEDVIWILPIDEKLTIGHVITLNKTRNYKFILSDGEEKTIECDSEMEQEILFNGIKKYFPHAQFGYNVDVLKILETNRNIFFKMLDQQNLYTPLDTFIH